MALISLTGQDTAEAFRLDDSAIIYAVTEGSGARLHISDNKVDTRNTLDVTQTPATIAALTPKLMSITDTKRGTLYINTDRVVEVKNSGDSDNNAVLVYDDNGDEYRMITINQTIAQFITSYNTATRPKTIYKATISQDGTAAPTVTILENSIGTITWTRSSAGVYIGTKTGAFTVTKTFYTLTANDNSPNSSFLISSFNNEPDQIRIETRASSSLTDGMLLNTPILIEVYE